MKATFKALIVSAAIVTGSAHAAGSIFVSEPGADGFNINTKVFNGSSYAITKLTFDFTSSLTKDGSHIVIDGSPFDITAPVGGSASFFGSGAVFGFDFTEFNTFEKFSFAWDPDSAISGAYGATGLDFIGAKITAVTTGGTYSGMFERVGSTLDVTASLMPSPIPEPESYGLALAGVALLALSARRKPKA